MQVIEAQCASILVPHDHLHINQKSAPVGRMNGCTIHLEGTALRWTYLSVPDEKTSVARV
jgi:hypothetical protein